MCTNKSFLLSSSSFVESLPICELTDICIICKYGFFNDRLTLKSLQAQEHFSRSTNKKTSKKEAPQGSLEQMSWEKCYWTFSSAKLVVKYWVLTGLAGCVRKLKPLVAPPLTRQSMCTRRVGCFFHVLKTALGDCSLEIFRNIIALLLHRYFLRSLLCMMK